MSMAESFCPSVGSKRYSKYQPQVNNKFISALLHDAAVGTMSQSTCRVGVIHSQPEFTSNDAHFR
jgi:hypothetical protein